MEKTKSATYQKRHREKKKKKFEKYFSFYQYSKRRDPKLLIEFKLGTYGVPAEVERVCQKNKSATNQKRYREKKKKKLEKYFSFYQYAKRTNPKLLTEFELDTYGVPAEVERVCQADEDPEVEISAKVDEAPEPVANEVPEVERPSEFERISLTDGVSGGNFFQKLMAEGDFNTIIPPEFDIPIESLFVT